jgi:hypothetical protein
MLDSLGNLGGLGQITKMLDAGNWIKQGVNSVLPKNMHVVGDAAGALFDLKTGNLLGAAQLGMEAMKDLPQATKSQQQPAQQQTAGGTLRGAPVPANPTLEPPPPPTTGKSIDLGGLLDILKQLTALLGGAKADSPKPSADSPPGDASSKAADTSAKTASTSTSAKPRSTTTTTTTTTTTRETTSGWRGSPVEAGATEQRATSTGWRGEPRTPAPASTSQTASAPTPASTSQAAATPAPATTSQAATTPAPATNTAAAPASSASPASAPASTASPNGETISSMAQLNSMSDSAIRDAVIHGRISPEVAKDQTAMMAIQQRMNSISEMNNLMTNMMRALHDMQMAVIQNIRI